MCRLLFLSLLSGLLVSRGASGQAVTVQQPSVGVFSVDTVVSVPDRGGMFLGGVGSAGWESSSAGFGPLRSSAFSRFNTGSSADARVFIHDLEAMDEDLLSRPAARSTSNGHRSSAAAEDAWLFGERHRTVAPQTPTATASQPITRPSPSRQVESTRGPPQSGDPSRLAEFYLSRGRDAETLGKTGAAALCYKMAAKYGSRDAEERLLALRPATEPGPQRP